LNSILNQDYTNFHVVVTDDASEDGTATKITDYLKLNNVSDKKVTLIKNEKRQHALHNIYNMVHKYCKQGEYGFVIDGDD
jgi:glycosyltransferase involved in cell wall biosynthesis